jgi:hypothetical protein
MSKPKCPVFGDQLTTEATGFIWILTFELGWLFESSEKVATPLRVILSEAKNLVF